MKGNKYTYLYVLQGKYGFGWEDLCASEDWKDTRDRKKEYEDSERGEYRTIKRRTPLEAEESRK